MHKKGLSETGNTRPYPIEWESAHFSKEYKPLKLEPYNGKGSPNKYMYYFLSQTDYLIGNDPIMTKIFTDTLCGSAFT